MYLVYLLKEKSTGNVIYVGSSSRPAARMKEHLQMLRGRKKNNQKLYDYMRKHNLQLYKDVEVIWVDVAENREEMYKLEAEYYYRYEKTLTNDRPAEDRNGSFNPKRRKVRCKSENKIFDSILECCKYYKIPRTTFMRMLNQEYPKYKMYSDFEYVD